ncbi:MAG: type IV pilus twitching motility protein PilT [Myxococcales bacterium]|nr:type IV pilus twitching motility protein PilT [Myxococcales bacterium]
MNLDYFARNLKRLLAEKVVLASGKAVLLRFSSGDRYAQQTLSHDELTQILLESAPQKNHDLIFSGRPPDPYLYSFKGESFGVGVEAGVRQWRITLQRVPSDAPVPGSAAAPVATPAPAASPAPVAPRQRAAVPTPSVAGEPDINRLLRGLVAEKGADLHLTAGQVPRYRVSGSIVPVPGMEVLTEERLRGMLYEILPERVRKKYEETWDGDFAHAIEGLSRFRCNIARDRHGTFSVIRRIPFEILTPEQIGLPPKVLDLCWLTKGLVLVTGPTGSGKSTTMATMIDFINSNRRDHIITIEDPVEFVHPDTKRCLIRQREAGEHTGSFKRALKAALREDPDIVLVGEMRDLETIAIATETAETGHLVFGTLHTSTAPSTVDRIIDQFPADRQEQIRIMLSESLRGVIAQTLCKKIGGGRVAAYEILISNHAVANLIREGKTVQLFSIMQTGKAAGNILLADSLLALVMSHTITPEEAFSKATNKDEFRLMLDKAGIKVDVGAMREE